LRIVLDKSVPVGELLKAAEAAGFDVMVTSDQNIRRQQNLTGRKLALVVLGFNIWPWCVITERR